MNLQKLAFLFLVGAFLASGNVTDKEVDDAFKELERVLNDRQEFQAKIDDVKKEVTKGPDVATRLVGMTKALNLAVPKLKSSDSWEVAQGVLNVVAGIAENFPGGLFIAPLASLISSIIGLVSSTKTDNTIRDIVRQVVRETSDRELEGKAAASRAELTAAMSYLQSKHSQTLDSNDVTRMVVQINVNTGTGILELLANRIKYRAEGSTAEEARQCLMFCFLYAQIASFRDMVINDLIILIRRAGDNDEANGYENAKSTFINSYRTTLNFLNHPKPSQAGAVHAYHPAGHAADTLYVKEFMNMAGVPEPIKWLPSKYALTSVKWPLYHAFMHTSGYVRLAQGLVPDSSQVKFVQRADGYWELQQRGKWLTIDTAYPDYVGSSSTAPGSNQRGHFIVVKYPDSDIITISCRKWPQKFWKGVTNTYYVRIRDGNTGKDVQFRARVCKNFHNIVSRYGYRCGGLP